MLLSIFAKAVTDEWGTSYQLTTAGYTALVLCMVVILLAGCAIFGKGKKLTAKQLAFSAMAIALAMVTSMLKVVNMPMGGSVTLFSMLFIVLIGYWYGLGAGLTTAIAYGILQLIIDPYIISFPQMLLDYVFAFGALGLSGIFSKSKHGLIKGYLAGVLGRYFFTFLSGWIFFATYTPEFFNSAVVYSLAYNGAYIGLEALITMILISLPPVNKALGYVKEIAEK
ncbi:MAG: energy-coupled thiamine transporter ThiT [Agathobacter sp.]|nr:energy-coupled thiamine transporter ThiT [Agathobacter sp.]MBQ2283406.1 energy-coupled thiamine transporter ThiT [Agathobacter sp.]